MSASNRMLYSTALVTPARPTLAERNIHFSAWSASCRVLNTPELLEKILTRINPIRLFPLRRTNSVFRDTLNSPALRRHLHLEHATGSAREEAIAGFLKHHAPWPVRPGRRPRKATTVNDHRHLISKWHPTIHPSARDLDGSYNNGDTEIYLDFGQCREDAGELAFNGLHLEHSTGDACCRIFDWCTYLCPTCISHSRKRAIGVRNTRRPCDLELKQLDLYGFGQSASWEQIKLLNVALPVKLEVCTFSRGLLYSPQRDPNLPWATDLMRMEITLSPEEATLGSVFAFFTAVTNERIRVNSGSYAPLCRAMCRKWLGPGETYLDDEEWNYVANVPRD